MTRLDELTLNLADDAITDVECQELQTLLAESPQAKSAHIKILQIEAGLRVQRQDLNVVEPVMKSLRSAVADSVTRKVMTQIKIRPLPEWRRKRVPNWLTWGAPFLFSTGRIRSLFARLWLPIAICLVLAAGFGVWYFNPTTGEPVLADIQGAGLILERSGQRLPISVGVRLQPGDLLRTSENATATIGYASENTRIKVLPGTELTLAALSRGKLFDLDVGKLEAVVSRQTPFRPMIISTPQARARVVGTRFTLLVTNNSTRLDVTEGKVRFTRLSDEKFVQVSTGHYAVASADYELASLPATGKILREWWTKRIGNTNDNNSPVALLANPRFPDHPDGWDYLAKFETPNHWGTNYVARVCGYLIPPTTGDYTFRISTGHYGELYFSPDDNPQNRRWIAHVDNAQPRQWDARGQQSASITLKAGQRYYIEARQIQGTDEDDYLAVAWQGPGRSREVIPGKFIAPLQPPK